MLCGISKGTCFNCLTLSLQLGFDSIHFARIDYQDRAKRKGDKSLEVIWRGSKTFGSSSQVWNCDSSVTYFLFSPLIE